MSHELDRRQIWVKARERLFATLFLLPFAVGLSWAVLDDGWMFGHTGGVRQTVAEVTDVQREDVTRRWLVRFGFDGADGSPRRAELRYEQTPPFAVGDRLPFVHSLDGRPMARPVTPDEQVVMKVFFYLTLGVWALYLATLAVIIRSYLQRRRLLDHGIPESLASARLETRMYSMAGPPIPTWRLCAGQFDASLPGWRDYYSDWQKGPPPQVDADTPLPPLLRDPANSARHWWPVATWAAERNAAP